MGEITHLSEVKLAQRPSAPPPAWIELNELEQCFVVVLSKQTSAKTWWELYDETTTQIVVRVMIRKNTEAFERFPKSWFEDAQRYQKLNERLQYFRGKSISIPSQRTFKNIISFFEYVGWIGSVRRIEGKRPKKYYFPSHALIEKLSPAIKKYVQENDLNNGGSI